MFDPANFNFTSCNLDGYGDWVTLPTKEGLIGKYELSYDRGWFDLYEIYYHNDDPKSKRLYYGKIPNDEFAFELFKNMELELPVIKRHMKIEKLIH